MKSKKKRRNPKITARERKLLGPKLEKIKADHPEWPPDEQFAVAINMIRRRLKGKKG